jgi:exopolyphosphatase/pppGpp-phosphohydrolase
MSNTLYLIDVGSSTIKTYVYDGSTKMIEERSIYFKNGFNEETGLSFDTKHELLTYFGELKNKYNLNNDNTKIYATGIFRKMSEEAQRLLINDFNDSFLGLTFDIISHDMENYYLEKALEGDYNNKKVLIINMGGKTTELVTFKEGQAIDKKNLEVGVADLLNKFPKVNEVYADVKIDKILNFVKSRIKRVPLDQDYDCAIFTGGELRFERLTGYNLIANTLFEDELHPSMVTIDDFIKGNNKIFYEMTMDELHNLMPHNPKWMDGARPGAILPQAIFEIAKINVVIPSDINLIDGDVKSEIKPRYHLINQ